MFTYDFSHKYRRKMIFGQYCDSIKEIIQRLCSYLLYLSMYMK